MAITKKTFLNLNEKIIEPEGAHGKKQTKIEQIQTRKQMRPQKESGDRRKTSAA